MDLNSLKYLRIGVLTTLVAVATLVYACGKENLSEPEEESEVMNTGATATKQAASAPPGGNIGAVSTLNPESSMHPQFCSNQWKPCPTEKVPQPTQAVYKTPFAEFSGVPIGIPIRPYQGPSVVTE